MKALKLIAELASTSDTNAGDVVVRLDGKEFEIEDVSYIAGRFGYNERTFINLVGGDGVQQLRDAASELLKWIDDGMPDLFDTSKLRGILNE